MTVTDLILRLNKLPASAKVYVEMDLTYDELGVVETVIDNKTNELKVIMIALNPEE